MIENPRDAAPAATFCEEKIIVAGESTLAIPSGVFAIAMDLLTEAGDALDLALVGYAGGLTVTGGMDSALLTESGLDLLTESGDALTGGRQNGGTAAAFGRVVLRGTCAVAGQASTLAGTGRIIDITPPVTTGLLQKF